MTRFEVRGNTAISETMYNVHTFEIVEKIPSNFFVWNIGENMGHSEYIPICEKTQQDKNCFDINVTTLKAIKLPIEEVQLLRTAAGFGVTNKKEAEKALKNNRKGYISNKKRYHAEKTIEIFNRISE